MAEYKLSQLKDIKKEIWDSQISTYKCPINHDIEYFLLNRAKYFEKQHWASTYCMFTNEPENVKDIFIAYFTLSIRTIVLENQSAELKSKDNKLAKLSDKLIKRLYASSRPDKELDRYLIAMPLIGQLGKNFYNGYNELVHGNEVLDFACQVVWDIQQKSSGEFVYLECEDTPVIKNFYIENNFVEFGKRYLNNGDSDKYLVRMIKYLTNEYR